MDNSGYTEIVKQVRDKEFNSQLEKQIKTEEKLFNQRKLLDINEALGPIEKKRENLEKEIQELKSELKQVKKNNENAKNLAIAEALKTKNEANNNLEKTINKLENDLNNEKTSRDIKINEIKAQKDLEREKATAQLKEKNINLENNLKTKDLEKESLKESLENRHLQELQNKEVIIKYKDEEIERAKDLKQKLSTKMLGESLEQHCEMEFNTMRAQAREFRTPEFGKDNEIKDGTKGDYIYREKDEFGNEILSIMFEMKNENENTTAKKKNEDFFLKLDKDRKNKNCEYAILVSLLESDNDFYNTGIADVSYEFEKMYVIRPQFFIPIISLLRDSAMKSLKYKQDIEVMKNKELDITNFENKISDFRDGFAKNYDSASKNFNKAIVEIDNAIKKMNTIRSSLLTSENQLRLANDKAQDLTIKKLTHNNSTMKNKFNNL
jgi:hypothetical protein